MSINEPQHVTSTVFGCSDIPQRPPFQGALIHHVGSLQDCIRGRGQTHT